MADPQKLGIHPRAITGKKVSRLRRDGILPGVVFGGHKDSTPVQTDLKTFERGYRRWGTTTLLTLTGLDGDQPALIHDVSRSTLTGRLLHVDFLRVSLTEKVHAEVPLHFVGESPAEKAGAVLVHAKSEVNVEAFPQDIPHSIEVDVSGLLEVDDSIYVRDLKVDAAKVEILDEADELLVRVVPVRVEAEPTPAAAEVPAEGAEVVEGVAPAEGEAAAPAKPGAPTGAAGTAPKPAATAPAAPKPGAPAKPEAQKK